jgi:large subunit ribosomal protein L30
VTPARRSAPAPAAPAPGAPAPGTALRVTQVRSSASTKPKHRGTLRALGLRGVGRSRVLPDRPEVRGMIARVPHLVEVGPATTEELHHERARTEAGRAARRAAESRRRGGPADTEESP